jgi:hypothetical protein
MLIRLELHARMATPRYLRRSLWLPGAGSTIRTAIMLNRICSARSAHPGDGSTRSETRACASDPARNSRSGNIWLQPKKAERIVCHWPSAVPLDFAICPGERCYAVYTLPLGNRLRNFISKPAAALKVPYLLFVGVPRADAKASA